MKAPYSSVRQMASSSSAKWSAFSVSFVVFVHMVGRESARESSECAGCACAVLLALGTLTEQKRKVTTMFVISLLVASVTAEG